MDCSEVFTREAAKKKNLKQSIETVLDSRFEELHQEGKNLIRSWGKCATDKMKCADEDSFEPFIFAWIALNGWASCVTGKDNDRECVDALMLDTNLYYKFEDQLRDNLEFKGAAQDFRKLWPIFRSKKIGFESNSSQSRQEIIARYRKLTPVLDHKPQCAFSHVNGTEIPLDWPHTLSAIYQVRCNLFHGYKGLHSENDVLIVSNTFRILVRLLPILIGCEVIAHPQIHAENILHK